MPLVVIPVPKHTWDMDPSHRPSGLESLELARGVNDYGTLTHTLFEPRDHAIHVIRRRAGNTVRHAAQGP